MAKIINTADLRPDQTFSADHASWIYNGLDSAVTAEIYEALAPQLTSVTAGTYEISRALQGPILDMNMCGLLVDPIAHRELMVRYSEQLDKLAAWIDELFRDGYGVEVAWRSPQQLKWFLYDYLLLPIQRKRNANGRMVPTADRAALEKLQHIYIAAPLINTLLQMRDIAKKLGFLQTELDDDGCIRTSFNIAGTNTGRLASAYSDFGTGCVRPTAEALTPNGWRSISELKNGDHIAQWDNGEITFVPAMWYWTEFSGNMLRVCGQQIDLTVTPGHRVLWRRYQNAWQTTAAITASNASQGYIPLAGKHYGVRELPPYVAMLMADASREATQWRMSLKRTRKIARMQALLDTHGVLYTEQRAAPGYRRFAIRADVSFPKTWGPWVLTLTQESLAQLVEEARHWDAHDRGSGFIFYTADADQAEWFAIACNLSGRGTTTRSRVNSDKAYGNNSVIYAVNVKSRSETQFLHKHWELVPYTGTVGCPQVPSSYWLVRENGKISVTGNTNLQNVDRNLRRIFIARKGKKLANLDLEQADSRNVGATCWNKFLHSHGPEFAGAYLDACESGDLHTTVTRMGWPSLEWGDDPARFRAVADEIAYRDYSYRDLAKRLGHGSNYYGQPPTMAKHAKIPVFIAEQFQRQYFAAFPCIQEGHKRTRDLLREDGAITTILGRQRYFFGRHNDDRTVRTAIAYEGQSATADEINLGLLALWRGGARFPGFQLLCQVHDSVLFEYDEECEAEIIPWALDALSVSLELAGGRSFTVPTEAKVGWNWGDVSEANPDGLSKWKGHDKRTRSEQPGRKLRFR